MKNIEKLETKKAAKDTAKEFESALNALKKKKEEKGIIPSDNKKVVIIDGKKDFSGKVLKIQKGLFKNGQNYTYSAGTKWEELDVFAKKNIHFSESDFV